MSDKYKAIDNRAYFVTLTIVDWIDVFTRVGQKNSFIDSLRYCQQYKGLIIYAYCIMSSHVHMICQAEEGFDLKDIVRDLKKFTSKRIIEIAKEEPESRREWLLKAFKKACEHLKRNQEYKVWQNGYHAEVIFSNRFLYQKIDYIHDNPVEEGIVTKPEDYLFSSARNYAGLDYLLEVELIIKEVKTYYYLGV